MISARLIGKGAASASATTTSAGVSASSGSSFFVGFSYDSTASVTSVTDSKGNIYSKVGATYTGSGFSTEIWASENGIGGSAHTVTVQFSSTAYSPVHFIEVLGAQSSGIDVVTGRNGDSQQSLVISVGPFSQPDEVVLAQVASGNISNAYSDSTGTFTKLSEEADGNSFWPSALFARVIGSNSSFGVNFGDGNPGGAFLAGSIISVKASSALPSSELVGAHTQATQVQGGTIGTTTAGTSAIGLYAQSIQSHAGTLVITGSSSLIGSYIQATQNHGGVLSSSGPSTSVPVTGSSAIDVDVQFTGTSPLTADLGTTDASNITVVVMHGGRLTAHAVPTDTKGNTYEKLGAHIPYTLWGPDFGVDMYAASGLGGGRHVKSTIKTGGAFNESEEATFIAVEVKRGSTVSGFTQTEILKDAGPLTHPSVTVTGPATLIAGWWGDDGGGPHTAVPDNGFAVVQEFLSGVSGSVQGAVATRDVVSAGTYTTTWTETPNQGAILFLVAVQAAVDARDLSGAYGQAVQAHAGTLEITPVRTLLGSHTQTLQVQVGSLATTAPNYSLIGTYAQTLHSQVGSLATTVPTSAFAGAYSQTLHSHFGTLEVGVPTTGFTGVYAQSTQSHMGALLTTVPVFAFAGTYDQTTQVHDGSLNVTAPGFNFTGSYLQAVQAYTGTLSITVPVFDLIGTAEQTAQDHIGALSTTTPTFDFTGAVAQGIQIHTGALHSINVPSIDLVGAFMQAMQAHSGVLTITVSTGTNINSSVTIPATPRNVIVDELPTSIVVL